MIFTSYYAKFNDINRVFNFTPISISLSRPSLQYMPKIIELKQLAPSWELLKQYKQNHDKEAYIQQYTEQVLSKIDVNVANKLINYLNGFNMPVLFCWEKSDAFCHRHLLANHINNLLGKEEIIELAI